MKRGSSPAQLAANRRNARKSTGPRTGAGRKRSSKNALRHGLRAAGLFSSEDVKKSGVAQAFIDAGYQEDPSILAAAARQYVIMVRATRLDLLNSACDRLNGRSDIAEDELVYIAYATVVSELLNLDRYERKALSRWKKAMRALSQE